MGVAPLIFMLHFLYVKILNDYTQITSNIKQVIITKLITYHTPNVEQFSSENGSNRYISSIKPLILKIQISIPPVGSALYIGLNLGNLIKLNENVLLNIMRFST